jgi:hypothetical protein
VTEMLESQYEFVARLRRAGTELRLKAAASRLSRLLKQNPNWHLQPRVPAGLPTGGRWIAFIGASLPTLYRVTRVAARRLRELSRNLAPRLRNVPRKWDPDQPAEESYDDETRRISANSKQRFGHPVVRFSSERELRDFLGPAGSGREWHHIVEKRMAGRNGYPVELIHSTDNIISLPVDVHRRVSARMSTRFEAYKNNVMRFEVGKLSFEEQYNIGLELVADALQEFGYDPSAF